VGEEGKGRAVFVKKRLPHEEARAGMAAGKKPSPASRREGKLGERGRER